MWLEFMTLSRWLVGTILVAALLPANAALAEPASAPALAPHRAVYELGLTRSVGVSTLASARGRIAFDFTGSACEGYVQNFRQITELQPSEGATRLSDMRSATYEAGDGHDFRFKIETKIDSTKTGDIDGKAMKANDRQLSIDLSKPKRTRIDFDGPTLFPTEHIRRLLAAAREGETIVEAKVFDGSGDGEKVFDTMTVIGKPIAAAAGEKAVQIDPMKTMRRWPMTISYFEPGKKDQQAIYVLSLDLYDNGVSRALKLDYGDFALKGDMTELTLLPAKGCDK